MVTQFRALCAAVDTVDNLTVIPTMWLAGKKDWSLPAVIIDASKPLFDELIEDGSQQDAGAQYYLQLTVKHQEDNDPLKTIELLMDKWVLVHSALKEAFPDNTFTIIDPDFIDVTFGKQTGLAFVCDLEIS